MKRYACMVVLAAASMVGTAIAQPEQAGAGESSQPQSEGTAGGRAALRERIEQRRAQLRRSQERIDLAIKLMDEGATIDRLREEYPELFRPARGGGGPEGPDLLDGPPGAGMGGGRRPGMRGGEGPQDERGMLDGPERFERGGPGGGPGGGEGRPGGERGRDRPGADRPPTDEERAAMREFLRVGQPRLFEAFQELEERDPEEAKRKLVEMFPRVRPLLEMRQNDPQMFELRMKDLRNGREAMEAARWLAQHEQAGSSAGSDDLAKRRESMRAALLKQFDARTEIHRRELDRQSERLTEARAELETRAAERNKSVEATMARMIEREQERLLRGEGPDDEPPPREPGRRPGQRGDR